MEAIGFPISREAACCGIYIYLGSTRVGMKSKEALRSDYLRMYEDNYRADLEKRRAKKTQQGARDKGVSSPASSSEPVSANSFLSIVNSIPKAAKKQAIVIDIDFSLTELGATWEEPAQEPRVVKSPVKEPVREWASNGTELFSIRVSTTVSVQKQPKQDDLWESGEEEAWVSEDEEAIEPVNVSSSVEDFDWDSEDEEVDWVPEDEYIEPIKTSSVAASSPEPPKKEPAAPVMKTFSEVKTAPRVEQGVVSVERLDENAIRDFVKSHKLCTESEIIKAFEGYDKTKVRSVIKSALRKYRIFEKHGKYTV